MYPYIDKDLIENPITYEFSAYLGKTGLENYEAAREKIMDYCRINLTTLEGSAYPAIISSPSLNAFEQYFSCIKQSLNVFIQEVPDNKNQILTVGCFTDLLLKELEKSFAEKDEQILFIFIRKFEITKRLWSAYHSHSYRKIGDNCNEMLPYLLFANILAAYIDFAPTPEKKTIAFNSLLKINDTISSAYMRLQTNTEFILALTALEIERNIYQYFLNGRVE